MTFDISELKRRITASEQATTAKDKGDSFESLSEYLFEHLNGVVVQHKDQNTPSEEIDLVLWNAQVEDVLRPWEAIILVECKNWSTPSGAPVLDSFIGKMRRRRLTTGIFIAANGVTGNYNRMDGAIGIIQAAMQDGIRVITITLDDIKAITSLDDIRELIRIRFCGLFIFRVL